MKYKIWALIIGCGLNVPSLVWISNHGPAIFFIMQGFGLYLIADVGHRLSMEKKDEHT